MNVLLVRTNYLSFELYLFQVALAQLEAENPSANNQEYKRLTPRRQKQSSEQLISSNIPFSNHAPLDRRRPNSEGPRRRPNVQPESSASPQNFQQNTQHFSSRENVNVPRRLKTENLRTRAEIPPRLSNEERATPAPFGNEFPLSPSTPQSNIPQRVENIPSTRIPQQTSDAIQMPANHRLEPISPQNAVPEFRSIPEFRHVPEFRPLPTGPPPPKPAVIPNAVLVSPGPSLELQSGPSRSLVRNSGRRGGQRHGAIEDNSTPRSTTSSEEIVTRRNFPSRTRSRGGSREQIHQVRRRDG